MRDVNGNLIIDIEKPLRRKFRSESKSYIWQGLVIALVIITLVTILLSRITNDQAHAAEVSRQQTYSSLCPQYKADHIELGNSQEEQTLKEICK